MTLGRLNAAPMAIGLGIANLVRLINPSRRRRRPTADELMRLNADDFEEFIRSIGLRTVSMLEPTADGSVAD